MRAHISNKFEKRIFLSTYSKTRKKEERKEVSKSIKNIIKLVEKRKKASADLKVDLIFP